MDLRLDTPLVTFKEGRFLAVWQRFVRFPWLGGDFGLNYTENLLLGCLVAYERRFCSNRCKTTPGRRSLNVWNGTMRFGAMGIAPGGKGGRYYLEICRLFCLQAQLEGRVSAGYRPGMPGMRGHNGQHECY